MESQKEVLPEASLLPSTLAQQPPSELAGACPNDSTSVESTTATESPKPASAEHAAPDQPPLADGLPDLPSVVSTPPVMSTSGAKKPPASGQEVQHEVQLPVVSFSVSLGHRGRAVELKNLLSITVAVPERFLTLGSIVMTRISVGGEKSKEFEQRTIGYLGFLPKRPVASRHLVLVFSQASAPELTAVELEDILSSSGPIDDSWRESAVKGFDLWIKQNAVIPPQKPAADTTSSFTRPKRKTQPPDVYTIPVVIFACAFIQWHLRPVTSYALWLGNALQAIEEVQSSC